MTFLAATLLVLSPAATPPVDRGGASDWIPFEFFRDSYVFVDVLVNGVPVSAALDSGAAASCVSARLAEQLGLEGGVPVAAQGVGGTVPAELFRGVAIEVAGRRVESVQVVAIDFNEVERGLGRRFPVILGRNFFTDFVVDIDYPHRRLALRDREDFAYEGPGFELALSSTAGGLWAVELDVEGATGHFLVDTGSGGPMGFDGRFARDCGLLEEGVRSTTTWSGGVGGMSVERMTTLDELALGDARLTGVPVRFSLEHDTGREVGGIGSPLLARFRVLFDVPRLRLILEPHAASLAEPFAKNRFGLEFEVESSGLHVVHVCEESPAAKAGWTAGERIVAIDGEPVGEDYWLEQYRWRQAAPGTQVVLLDGAGERRELTAADFY